MNYVKIVPTEQAIIRLLYLLILIDLSVPIITLEMFRLTEVEYEITIKKRKKSLWKEFRNQTNEQKFIEGKSIGLTKACKRPKFIY